MAGDYRICEDEPALRAGWALGLLTLGLLTLGFGACSGLSHDCVEMRNCASPKAIIEAGPRGAWWESGGSGPFEEGEAGSAQAGAMEEAAGSAGAFDAPAMPPRIVGLVPSDAARGVSSDAQLVIAFSQAMDPVSTEAAYRSGDLPATGLNFHWDAGLRIVTLTPRAPLRYGDETGSVVYRYGFDGSARDIEGRPLPPIEFSFHTLRQLGIELPADSERTGNWTDTRSEGIHNCLRHPEAPYEATVCVGDDLRDVRYWGFLSFDLSPIPEQVRQIQGARLRASAAVHGAPEALGENRLEHVRFDALDEAAMNAAPQALLGPFFSGVRVAAGSQITLGADLTRPLAEDCENRVALQQRSQYRIGFTQGSANSHWDDLELPTKSIRLVVSYLIP